MKDPIRVTTATKFLRSLRRRFARNEWAIWLLGLKRTTAKPTDPGLILIQIDGLAKRQLESAMEEGRMPFLRKLLQDESYRNHLFYSGLPSSTPAVQAELHYGVRGAVPAFGFRDHETGKLVRMFSSETAGSVEAKLSEENEGLLNGGSSYANIYSGGAEEVHYCAVSFGWSEFLSKVNPLRLSLVLVLNIWMFFRVAALMTLEFFIATLDFVRGLMSGKRFWQELIMIPARVVVVVLLRELVTVSASSDAARGLPIIHLNYLGYDEQAHRRGPSSRFAHWTLRGIDSAIHRLWKAAHRSSGREYDFWIFSDHGQETTTPYEIQHGELVQAAVAEVVEQVIVGQADEVIPSDGDERGALSDRSSRSAGRQNAVREVSTRANWVGLGWIVSMLFGEQDHDIQSRSPYVQTVTSGPVGFVYLLTEETRRHRADIARRLVEERQVPMVAYQEDAGSFELVTDQGTFALDSNDVGPLRNHPFRTEIVDDLKRMVSHADSGDILLVGWAGVGPVTSFVLQHGAHAGPGTEETSGFALLPSDVQLPNSANEILRPADLRLAALRFLGRDSLESSENDSSCGSPKTFRKCRVPSIPPSTDRCRVLTYNVHGCVGMDGQLSPERIARVIDQSAADIICMQEVDVSRKRSAFRDQAQAIALHLEMTHEFHPAWHVEEEKFGNAILTRLPMRTVRKEGLYHQHQGRSRRSAQWVEIELRKDLHLQIINTHLSIYPLEQKTQAQQLIDEWIQPAMQQGPTLLCGDFNAPRRSATYRLLASALRDIEDFDANRPRNSLFSPLPVSRVDHGFVSEGLSILGVHVLSTRLAKVASDHLPVSFDVHCE